MDISTTALKNDNAARVMQITREYAHVVREENLFVHEVTQIAQNRFKSEFTVDGTHPYLYENSSIANHVSGTTFLDMSRQLLKAITHFFYSAPVSNRFVIRSVEMDFTRWAKLDIPIQTLLELVPESKIVFGHSCLTFKAHISCHQEGWKIGTMKGEFTTFPLEVEDKLMSRQYRQAPRLVSAHASQSA